MLRQAYIGIISVKMYRRPSKKKQLAKRIAIYAVMVVSVLIGVAGLIFLILGYRFDADNGRIEQGSLLQFATIPSGATIQIDGKTINARTPTKSTVLAGTHTFMMQKNGYETWQKTLDVKAGTLTWLTYARLVPVNRPVESVSNYERLAASLAAPGGDYIIAQQDAATATFQLIDLRSDTVQTNTLTIPAAVISQSTTPGVAHSYVVDSWDSGGRYVIIRHAYGDKKEWIVLDTRDASASKNITTLLDLDLTSLVFSGTSGSILYALSGSDIRKLDVSAGTISRSLVSGVTSFSLFETNVITYVGTDKDNPTGRVAGLYREGDSASHILKSISNDPTKPLHIATGRYFNQDFVAISVGSNVEIMSGSYPSSGSADSSSLAPYDTFEFVTNVDQLGFSPAGDYLLVQSGSRFAGFDIEHHTLANSTIANDASDAVAPLRWLDDNYVWSDFGGNLTMREFDGANVHVINTSLTGQAAALTKNDKYIYSFGKTATGYQLQRVRMVLP